MIFLTVLSLPFMLRQPVDLPPIVSVELIQISDKTNIPFAPKARKIIEEAKKKEERVVSEQAPPAAKAKEKPDRIPLPDEKKRIKRIHQLDQVSVLNEKVYHLEQRVLRKILFVVLRCLTRFSPNLFFKRLDWIYNYKG